jgi:hypothetical protein
LDSWIDFAIDIEVQCLLKDKQEQKEKGLSMKLQRTKAEYQQIINLIQEKPSFLKVFSDDWTKIVMDELRNRMFGKIPRNFFVNIGGLIGTPTGIFKSSMGLQIALDLDPTFTLAERVGFSVNDLLDKIKRYSEHHLCNEHFELFKKNYDGTYEEHDSVELCQYCGKKADVQVAKTKMIFFLDEQMATLKVGGLTRLKNIVDSCRQRQICFITCGVDRYGMNFSTYSLERVQESDDRYLPLKKVRYAVYDNNRDFYYGYFVWDIIPLTDEKWKKFWNTYSEMKSEFQRVAINQQTQSMNFGDYAKDIMDSVDFIKCFKISREGRKRMDMSMVKTLIFKKYPDLTNDERKMVLQEIKFELVKDEAE